MCDNPHKLNVMRNILLFHLLLLRIIGREIFFIVIGKYSSDNALCSQLFLCHDAKIVIDQPYDYTARAEIMWAGSLAHNGLTGCGRTGDWASHQLEHELSGMFDVAHGAGLAAIWSSWARYVYQADAERFARFAVQVMGISEQSQTQGRACAGGNLGNGTVLSSNRYAGFRF